MAKKEDTHEDLVRRIEKQAEGGDANRARERLGLPRQDDPPKDSK